MLVASKRSLPGQRQVADWEVIKMNMFAEIGTAAVEANQQSGQSPVWWIVLGGLAVIGGLYYVGLRVNARQSKVFGQRLIDDIVRLLLGRVNMSETELRKVVIAMWKQESGVDFGPMVERIEFSAQTIGSDLVKCSVAVFVGGDAPQRLTADREYNWDYLPNSVSKILIASKDGKDVRVLYAKSKKNK